MLEMNPSTDKSESVSEPMVTSPIPKPPGPPRSARDRKWWGFGVLGGAVLLGGMGIGWLLGNTGAPTAADSSTTTVAAAAATTPTFDAGEEPVAAVAQALLPSVVQIETSAGLGSGFVYEDGHVLTAAHVVDGSNTVRVRFADGRQADGQVVGADTTHDIAVIAVDTTDIPVAAMALDSQPVVGQLAVALGSPWGFEGTVTSGIVSAVDQAVPGRNGPQSLLQTDASINPGNSGGPLADRAGRVIGINVEIFTLTGSNSGVGFAVPIDVAHGIAQQIVAGTPIETAFLGISGDDATGDQAGAVIAEIVPDGPAAVAGLQVGDIVTGVGAQATRSMTELAALIRGHQPGDQVVLDVLRNGNKMNVTVTLSARTPTSN